MNKIFNTLIFLLEHVIYKPEVLVRGRQKALKEVFYIPENLIWASITAIGKSKTLIHCLDILETLWFNWLYPQRMTQPQPRYYFKTFRGDLCQYKYKQTNKKNLLDLLLRWNCTVYHLFIPQMVWVEAMQIRLATDLQ